MSNSSTILATLLGTAVGDALGLPYEGLSPRRASRLLGPPDRYRFILRRGMVSDDAEHACMTACALAASGGDPDVFVNSLAWRLRYWLLGLPAGVGLATLRSILKLWIGFSPHRSGVFSAGNGPAMRASLLGAAITDLSHLRRLIRASTRLTHTDPKAEEGAMVIALAARHACRLRGSPQPVAFMNELHENLNADECGKLIELLNRAIQSSLQQEATPVFAAQIGLGRGVSGYINHTVPIVIHAWLSHPNDYRAAVTSAIICGGDADTTAAMTGGIVACGVGIEGIPSDWLDGLLSWPRSRHWVESLALATEQAVKTAQSASPPRLPIVGTLARNIVFAAIVVVHALRRLLPPY